MHACPRACTLARFSRAVDRLSLRAVGCLFPAQSLLSSREKGGSASIASIEAEEAEEQTAVQARARVRVRARRLAVGTLL
eukprot:2342677-Pleurochrysis_carterae.AAC.2